MSRESLPPLLSLLKAVERFRADTLTEADRTLINLVLIGVTRDEDVRDYFWRSVDGRPPQHNSTAWCAAMMYAIAEARDEKHISKRVQATLDITRKQVDAAREKYGPGCQAAVAQWGLEFSDQYLQAHLEELRLK